MRTEERRERFKKDVADERLKTGGSRHDGALRIAGALLMITGVVGAFVCYDISLAQDDIRNVGSLHIMATGFVGVTVLGAALYVAAALARVLRLWLLRQLVESRARADQLTAALKG